MTSSETRPTVDFDHQSNHYAENWIETLDGIRSRCPVAWTDVHDGFWVLTKHADVGSAARDSEHFSTEHDVSGDGNGYGGIAIPQAPMRAIPLELDPPEATVIRNLLQKSFTPGAAQKWLPWLREAVDEQLDLIIEKGECDLIYDLGAVVPGRFTMKLLGLPESEWRTYALPFHDFMSPEGSDRHNQAITDLMLLAGRLYEHVSDRRRAPRDDFITYLTQCEVDGEPLSEQMITEICFLIVAGGVDTTTSLFGDVVEWLSRHPEERAYLAEDFDRLQPAIEEFLRYFSPTQNNARTVREDVEVGGQCLREGDRVMLSWAAANHDPEEFDAPEEVQLDRAPNRHLAFGVGHHRCLGSNFARVELRAMLEGVLTRMPDFVVDYERAQKYHSIGTVNGFLSVPASFTPGARLAAPTTETVD